MSSSICRPAGGVDDHDAVARALRLLDAGLGDPHDVLRVALGVDRHVELRAERLELIDGGGAVDVARRRGASADSRALSFRASLAAVVVLPEPCRPTIITTVGGTELSLSPSRRSPSIDGELVVDDFDELLAGRDGAKLRDADRLLLDALEELARELEVDVGLEQDATHLPQAFFDVGFGQDAATAQAREGRFEFLGQLVEHRPGKIADQTALIQATGDWLLASGCYTYGVALDPGRSDEGSARCNRSPGS